MSMRLGVFVNVREREEIESQVWRARDAGFGGIQVKPYGPELDQLDLHRLVKACQRHGMSVPVLSAYCDLLKPETSLMGFTLEDALRLADSLEPLGATGLVVWSGTLAPGLLEPHPGNRSSAAWKLVEAGAARLIERLERVGATLLIEPEVHHLASDVEACLRLAEDLRPGRVKFVLDPPNLMPPDRFAQQQQLMREMIPQLHAHIGLVHFKDARVMEDGTYEFPGPGEGELDYPLYINLLRQVGYEGWGIIEHVGEARWGEAGKFVREVMAKVEADGSAESAE